MLDTSAVKDIPAAVKDLTDGRGADGTLDAVGMEAHGSPILGAAVKGAGLLPDAVAKPMMKTMGVDRLGALRSAIGSARRGGTVSVVGVYGGMADPMPMMEIFDRQLSLRFGQCNVRHWVDDIVPLLSESEDIFGLETLATHRLSLDEAPHGYEIFQKKQDGCLKVVLKP